MTTDLDARAVALTAFRVLPNGEGRFYTATTFPQNPWQGCEHMIRVARHCGFISRDPDAKDGYAVLDVLDEDGDIIQDFMITTAQGFQFLKRKLHWQVQQEDDPR